MVGSLSNARGPSFARCRRCCAAFDHAPRAWVGALRARARSPLADPRSTISPSSYAQGEGRLGPPGPSGAWRTRSPLPRFRSPVAPSRPLRLPVRAETVVGRRGPGPATARPESRANQLALTSGPRRFPECAEGPPASHAWACPRASPARGRSDKGANELARAVVGRRAGRKSAERWPSNVPSSPRGAPDPGRRRSPGSSPRGGPSRPFSGARVLSAEHLTGSFRALCLPFFFRTARPRACRPPAGVSAPVAARLVLSPSSLLPPPTNHPTLRLRSPGQRRPDALVRGP